MYPDCHRYGPAVFVKVDWIHQPLLEEPLADVVVLFIRRRLDLNHRRPSRGFAQDLGHATVGFSGYCARLSCLWRPLCVTLRHAYACNLRCSRKRNAETKVVC